MNTLLDNEIFRLFAIIGIGKIIEQIKIKNFSLGMSSIFIVAIIAGSLGITIPPSFKYFGLAVFIYAIGIEAGPQFFSVLFTHGKIWLGVPILFSLLVAFFTVALAYMCSSFLDKDVFLGLFAGVFTCTPALSATLEKISKPLISVAFAIAYPISMIGNVYLIPALPKIFKDNLVKEEELYYKKYPRGSERVFRLFRVENEAVIGKSIETIKKLSPKDAVFTRYIYYGETIVVTDSLILQKNALVGVVVDIKNLEAIEIILGKIDSADFPLPVSMQVRRFIVSNREIAGKTLSEVLSLHHIDIRITRIIRSGVELSPEPNTLILLGDRLAAFGEEKDMNDFLKIVGDDLDNAYKTQFAPISMGITLGLLASLIPIPFLSSSLGMTGGILIISLFLGYKVRFMGILWQLSQNATAFQKQLGLSIFFAALGAELGPSVIPLLKIPSNWIIVVLALVCIVVPTIAMYAFTTRVLKLNAFESLGLLGGTVNNSSVLVALNENLKSDIPNTSFAFAYPLGLILTMVMAQCMAVIF